jgi:hypothetical protein
MGKRSKSIFDGCVKSPQTVIPAKAGIQNYLTTLDPGSSPE